MTNHERSSALAIPSLRIHGGPPPALLGLGPVVAPGTEWSDVDGRVAIRTALHAAGAAVELAGVGWYAVGGDGEPVDAWPAEGRTDEVVAAEFHRSVVPLLLSRQGALYLHGSAVLAPAGVVAFCGRSGAGKSTMAAALTRAGFRFWADDAVVFTGGSAGKPPMSVRLRSALRLDDTGTRLVGGAPATDGSAPGDVRPLAAVVVLARGAGAGDSRLDRLSAGAALSAVLEHALCFSLGAGDRARLVTSYMDVLDAVPVERLRFRPDAGGFPSVVDLVSSRLEALRR